MIGTFPEVTSRTLPKLEDKELIKMTEKGIEIINRQQLALIANLSD